MVEQAHFQSEFNARVIQMERFLGDLQDRIDNNVVFNSIDEIASQLRPITDLLTRLYDTAMSTADVDDDIRLEVMGLELVSKIRTLVNISGLSPDVVQYLEDRIQVARQLLLTQRTPTEVQIRELDAGIQHLEQMANNLGGMLGTDVTNLKNDRDRRIPVASTQAEVDARNERLEAIRNSDYMGYFNQINWGELGRIPRDQFDVVERAAARLSNIPASPESKLDDATRGELTALLNRFPDFFGFYPNNPLALRELRKIQYLTQQLLHEDRILQLGPRFDPDNQALRESLLRPTIRPDETLVPNEISGEMEMFIGNFLNDIEYAENMAMIVAERVKAGQDPRGILDARQRARLEDLLRRVSSYRDNQLSAMRLGQAPSQELSLFIRETEKYMDWVRTLLVLTEGTPAVAVPGVVTARHELPPKPETKDQPAWDKYFEAWYQLDGTGEELRNYMEEVLFPRLEQIDETYDKQTLFKASPEAVEFVSLEAYLKGFDKSNPQREQNYQTYLANAADFLSTRIEFIELMGPYGDSPGGFAALNEMMKKYPEFNAWQMQWLLRQVPRDGDDYTPIPEKNWEHSEYVERAFRKIDYLMNEYEMDAKEYYEGLGIPVNVTEEATRRDRGRNINPNFKRTVKITYQDPDGRLPEDIPKTYEVTEVSYDAGRWMGNSGNYHFRLQNRMLAELFDPRIPAADKWADPALPFWQIKRIWRLAYVNYMFARGRQTRFVEAMAAGASPPKFLELEDVLRDYPLAKEFNLATKAVLEIPSVVMGMKVDRYWLLKAAMHRGVIKHIYGRQQTNEGMGSINRRLIERLYQSPMAIVDTLNEREIEKLLKEIADENTEPQNSNHASFRNLLRSIFLSEEKAEWLGIKNIHHMQLQDEDGRPAHHDEHPYYLKPGVITPFGMVAGHLAPFIAKEKMRFDSVYKVVAEEMGKLHEHVHHKDPPTLKGGVENHMADIEALWGDFEQALKSTSPLKTGEGHLVNWDEVGELYEQRLRILVATYRDKYEGYDPGDPYGKKLPDYVGLGEQKIVSLVDYFLDKLRQESRQMSDNMSVVKDITPDPDHPGQTKLKRASAWDFEHPYIEGQRILSLREYLAALIDFRAPGVNPRDVYKRMLDSTERVSPIAWQRYANQAKQWNVSSKNRLNDSLMAGSGHKKAEQDQKSEVEESKQGAAKPGH